MVNSRVSITLVAASPGDEALVEEVFDQLRTYSMAVDGVPKRRGAAREFLTELPRTARNVRNMTSW